MGGSSPEPAGSLPGGPFLDHELGHGKVAGVARGEASGDAVGCGRHEAVGLGERPTLPGEHPPPLAGLPALGLAEWSLSEPGDQPAGRLVLRRKETARDLLDVDGADVRTVARGAERCEPSPRFPAPAEQIDQDGRVEKDSAHTMPLADAALVEPALLPDPRGRILVPLVPVLRDGAERRFDQLPPSLVVERLFDRPRDEGATTARPDAPVEFAHDLVAKRDVEAHVPKLAHY